MNRVENEGFDDFTGEGNSLPPPVVPAPTAVPVQGPAAAPTRLKPVMQRGLVALVLLIAYAGLVIGIWDRAVMSDRRHALASVETSPQHPSRAPAAPAPSKETAIPKAIPSAPSMLATNPVPAETKPALQKTTPPPAVSKPRVERRVRARAPTLAPPRRLPQVPIPQPQRDARPPAAVAVAVPDTGANFRPAIEPTGNPVREVSPDTVREPPAPVVAVDPHAADRSAVVDVLAAYRKSYNNLDADAASAVWKGVDERALRHAFSGLSRQHLSFDRCDVRVEAADRAAARCDGVLSYVAKVGDGGAQERHLTWSMDLRRDGDRWKIIGVKTR